MIKNVRQLYKYMRCNWETVCRIWKSAITFRK